MPLYIWPSASLPSPSVYGALPFFIDLMATLTSFTVGGSVHTSKSCSAGWMSASSSGSGLIQCETKVLLPPCELSCFCGNGVTFFILYGDISAAELVVEYFVNLLKGFEVVLCCYLFCLVCELLHVLLLVSARHLRDFSVQLRMSSPVPLLQSLYL